MDRVAIKYQRQRRPAVWVMLAVASFLIAARLVDGSSTVDCAKNSAETVFLAGDTTQGDTDGTGAAAQFEQPTGITWHPGSGWLWLADGAPNFKIKSIDPTTGVVTTRAGTGTQGAQFGATGTAVNIDPVYMAADLNFDFVYYTSSQASNSEIQIISTVASFQIEDMAGGTLGCSTSNVALGSTARFQEFGGIAYRSMDQSVYVSDTQCNTVVSTGTTTPFATNTLAGDGTAGLRDGTGTGAQFDSPTAVVFSVRELHLYVFNIASPQASVIRKITIMTKLVETVAGDGTNFGNNVNRAAMSAVWSSVGGGAWITDEILLFSDYTYGVLRGFDTIRESVVDLAGDPPNKGLVYGFGNAARLDSPRQCTSKRFDFSQLWCVDPITFQVFSVKGNDTACNTKTETFSASKTSTKVLSTSATITPPPTNTETSTHTLSDSLTYHPPSRTLPLTMTETLTFSDTITPPPTPTVTMTLTMTDSPTITPPPTPSETLTVTMSENTDTKSARTESYTVTEATETMSISDSLTLVLTESDTETLSLTTTAELTASESLPNVEMVRHQGVFEEALKTGEPEADRIIILKLVADAFLISRSAERGFFYRNTKIDISNAPSLQPHFAEMYNIDSVFTNQTDHIQIVFFPIKDFGPVRVDPPETVSFEILPSALQHQSIILPINFTIYPGSSAAPPAPLTPGREGINKLDFPLWILVGLGAFFSGGSPMMAFHLSQLHAVSSLTTCPSVRIASGRPLSWFESPTQFNMEMTLVDGEQYLGPYLGALVMNSVLAIGILLLHMGWTAIRIASHCEAASHQLLAYSMALGQFPSRTIGVVLLWWYPCCKMSSTIFFSSTDPEALSGTGIALLGWLTYVIVLSWVCAVAPMVATTVPTNLRFRVGPSQYTQAKRTEALAAKNQSVSEQKKEKDREKRRKVAEANGESFLDEPLNPIESAGKEYSMTYDPSAPSRLDAPSPSQRRRIQSKLDQNSRPDPFSKVEGEQRQLRPCTRVLRRLFYPREEWCDRLDTFPSPVHPRLARWTYFSIRFHSMLSEYRLSQHTFFLVDILLTGTVGGLEGVASGTNSCNPSLWTMFALALLHTIFCLKNRPYNALFSVGFNTLMSLTVSASSLCGAIALESDNTRAKEATQMIVLVAMSLLVIRVAVETFLWFYETIFERIMPGEPILDQVPLLRHPDAILESGLLPASGREETAAQREAKLLHLPIGDRPDPMSSAVSPNVGSNAVAPPAARRTAADLYAEQLRPKSAPIGTTLAASPLTGLPSRSLGGGRTTDVPPSRRKDSRSRSPDRRVQVIGSTKQTTYNPNSSTGGFVASLPDHLKKSYDVSSPKPRDVFSPEQEIPRPPLETNESRGRSSRNRGGIEKTLRSGRRGRRSKRDDVAEEDLQPMLPTNHGQTESSKMTALEMAMRDDDL